MFLKYLVIFSVFSIVGWILEVIYRSIFMKKFINPGFMSGCVVPIYGFGAVILNLVCSMYEKLNFGYKLILIFILSTIFLSILELISGLFLHKVFKLRLWDYSSYKYNYKGFICLEFSLLWGISSIIYYLFIYPWFGDFAIWFTSTKFGIIILIIYWIIFLIDLCISIKLLSNLTKYAKTVAEIIDMEKLKIDSRLKANRKKFWNAIYPYISINKFVKERIKERK